MFTIKRDITVTDRIRSRLRRQNRDKMNIISPKTDTHVVSIRIQARGRTHSPADNAISLSAAVARTESIGWRVTPPVERLQLSHL